MSEPRFRARPTTYIGIPMRSRLEARMAAHLDNAGEPWEYEPRAFANRSGQYLPDFYLPPSQEFPAPIFLEVKPTLEQAEAALDRVSIILDSVPDAWLMVVAAEECVYLWRRPGSGWLKAPWEWND